VHPLLAQHTLGQHDACAVDRAVQPSEVGDDLLQARSTVTGALLRARPSVAVSLNPECANPILGKVGIWLVSAPAKKVSELETTSRVSGAVSAQPTPLRTYLKSRSES
jgi:hypothetical protein